MRGKRKDLGGIVTPTLREGDYGRIDDVWWAYPPGGQVTAVGHVTEHEDGTITAEFEHGGRKYRIGRGVWEPPAPH
jgi:hypothetical protein